MQITLHARLIDATGDADANKQVLRTCEAKALNTDEWVPEALPRRRE
jgi:hypothetical protein